MNPVAVGRRHRPGRAAWPRHPGSRGLRRSGCRNLTAPPGLLRIRDQSLLKPGPCPCSESSVDPCSEPLLCVTAGDRRSREPHPRLVRSPVRPDAGFPGKIRAPGRKWWTIVHRDFPGTRNFHDLLAWGVQHDAHGPHGTRWYPSKRWMPGERPANAGTAGKRGQPCAGQAHDSSPGVTEGTGSPTYPDSLGMFRPISPIIITTSLISRIAPAVT